MAQRSASKHSQLLTVPSETYISFGQYVCSGRYEISGKSLIEKSREQGRCAYIQYCAMKYLPIEAE
jgi:hypothetical protein